MKIHPQGYHSIVLFFFFGFLIDTALIFISKNNLFFILILSVITFIIGFLIFNFFKVPERNKVPDINKIYAPADGKIVTIEKIYDELYFFDERIQVSIFMSPTNVHVNWLPMSGKIMSKRYHPGKHLLAFNPKSSDNNERAEIVIKNENHDAILVRQVAGIIARRVVNYLSPNDQLNQFDEFGIIKFGSRLDVLLPTDVNIKVHMGQKVKGIETCLAEFS